MDFRGWWKIFFVRSSVCSEFSCMHSAILLLFLFSFTFMAGIFPREISLKCPVLKLQMCNDCQCYFLFMCVRVREPGECFTFSFRPLAGFSFFFFCLFVYSCASSYLSNKKLFDDFKFFIIIFFVFLFCSRADRLFTKWDVNKSRTTPLMEWPMHSYIDGYCDCLTT